MRINITEHRDYRRHDPFEAEYQYEIAKERLRVEFKIEFNIQNPEKSSMNLSHSEQILEETRGCVCGEIWNPYDSGLP